MWKRNWKFLFLADTITLSAPLLIISFIILMMSYLLFILAICSHKHKIFYFAAGIGFIISGEFGVYLTNFVSSAHHATLPFFKSSCFQYYRTIVCMCRAFFWRKKWWMNIQKIYFIRGQIWENNLETFDLELWMSFILKNSIVNKFSLICVAHLSSSPL